MSRAMHVMTVQECNDAQEDGRSLYCDICGTGYQSPGVDAFFGAPHYRFLELYGRHLCEQCVRAAIKLLKEVSNER